MESQGSLLKKFNCSFCGSTFCEDYRLLHLHSLIWHTTEYVGSTEYLDFRRLEQIKVGQGGDENATAGDKKRKLPDEAAIIPPSKRLKPSEATVEESLEVQPTTASGEAAAVAVVEGSEPTSVNSTESAAADHLPHDKPQGKSDGEEGEILSDIASPSPGSVFNPVSINVFESQKGPAMADAAQKTAEALIKTSDVGSYIGTPYLACSPARKVRSVKNAVSAGLLKKAVSAIVPFSTKRSSSKKEFCEPLQLVHHTKTEDLLSCLTAKVTKAARQAGMKINGCSVNEKSSKPRFCSRMSRTPFAKPDTYKDKRAVDKRNEFFWRKSDDETGSFRIRGGRAYDFRMRKLQVSTDKTASCLLKNALHLLLFGSFCGDIPTDKRKILVGDTSVSKKPSGSNLFLKNILRKFRCRGRGKDEATRATVMLLPPAGSRANAILPPPDPVPSGQNAAHRSPKKRRKNSESPRSQHYRKRPRKERKRSGFRNSPGSSRDVSRSANPDRRDHITESQSRHSQFGNQPANRREACSSVRVNPEPSYAQWCWDGNQGELTPLQPMQPNHLPSYLANTYASSMQNTYGQWGEPLHYRMAPPIQSLFQPKVPESFVQRPPAYCNFQQQFPYYHQNLGSWHAHA